MSVLIKMYAYSLTDTQHLTLIYLTIQYLFQFWYLYLHL